MLVFLCLDRSAHSSKSSFVAYNSHSVFVTSSDCDDGVTGSLFSIPSSFLNICNYPLLGMATSEQGNRILLYSATDLCVYIKELDMWRITSGIVDVSPHISLHL